MARRPATSRRGRGFLAVCGALVLPGLGHVVAGHVWRGMAWFGVWAAACAVMLLLFVTPRFVPGLLFVVRPYLACMLMHLMNAYRMGHRPRRKWLFQPHSWISSGVGSSRSGFCSRRCRGLSNWPCRVFEVVLCEAFFVPMASMRRQSGRGIIFWFTRRVHSLWALSRSACRRAIFTSSARRGFARRDRHDQGWSGLHQRRAVPLPPGVGRSQHRHGQAVASNSVLTRFARADRTD